MKMPSLRFYLMNVAPLRFIEGSMVEGDRLISLFLCP